MQQLHDIPIIYSDPAIKSQVKNYVSELRTMYDHIDVRNSANVSLRQVIRYTLHNTLGFSRKDAAIAAMKAEVNVETEVYHLDRDNIDDLMSDIVIVFYRSTARVCGYDYNLPIGDYCTLASHNRKEVHGAVVAGASLISVDLSVS